MSKSNFKYRWVDEEEDHFSRDGKRKSKKDMDRRKEKRQKNAIKSKNLNYFYESEEE